MNNKADCVVVGSIQTNCWLYPMEDENTASSKSSQPCFVIDPGADADLIISKLKELNWVPHYIFLTHGHFDHVTAVPDLLDAFEKGAFGQQPLPKTCIHRGDAHMVKNKIDIFFEEGDKIGPLKILHIPGHTQGCVGFYDEKTGILFSGDTLFRRNWGRTDLPGGNEEQIYKSLKSLLSMNGETVVYPGHGPLTTIKDEEGLLGN